MSYRAKQKKRSVSVEGAEEIIATLKEMGESASSVLEESAKAGGDISLKDAKENCPVDSGSLKESLQMEVDKVTTEKATVKIGFDTKHYYGVFVELGTSHNKAHPFLRNSVDKKQNTIKDAISKKISDAIGRVM